MSCALVQCQCPVPAPGGRVECPQAQISGPSPSTANVEHREVCDSAHSVAVAMTSLRTGTPAFPTGTFSVAPESVMTVSVPPESMSSPSHRDLQSPFPQTPAGPYPLSHASSAKRQDWLSRQASDKAAGPSRPERRCSGLLRSGTGLAYGTRIPSAPILWSRCLEEARWEETYRYAGGGDGGGTTWERGGEGRHGGAMRSPRVRRNTPWRCDAGKQRTENGGD